MKAIVYIFIYNAIRCRIIFFPYLKASRGWWKLCDTKKILATTADITIDNCGFLKSGRKSATRVEPSL